MSGRRRVRPSSSSSATSVLIPKLYWCHQCRHLVKTSSRNASVSILCPRCNGQLVTELRNPEFHYDWTRDDVRIPRLPPQPRRRRININERRGCRGITSLLPHPRPLRLRPPTRSHTQETDSADTPPRPSSPPQVQRTLQPRSSTVTPGTNHAVTRHPSRLIPPGVNPMNFIAGPEINSIVDMMASLAVEVPEAPPPDSDVIDAMPISWIAPPGSMHVDLDEIVRQRVGVLNDLVPRNDPLRHGSSDMEQSRWQKPSEGWVKLNVDATTCGSDNTGGKTGYGAVIRDHKGDVLAAAMKAENVCVEAGLAEALAVRYAINWALECCFTAVEVEVGSPEMKQTLISGILKTAQGLSEFGEIINDSHLLLSHFRGYRILDCCREANKVAEALAREATNMEEDELVWLEECPTIILDHVIADASGE